MNLFPKVQRPYYIWTPSYTHRSSGVRTLHLLCHALNESGQKAYIYPDNPGSFSINPGLNTPIILDYPEHYNFYNHSGLDPIMVYPDIVRGNPLNAKHVVRYLLAPAGAYGGDKIFSETDQVWGALPSIAKNVLRIPVSDPKIFRSSVAPRHGSCFYAHKYEMHGNQLKEVPVDCERVCGTLDQVAHILRTKKVCYMYEVGSVLTEAALCGCPIKLMRTPYFNTIDPECMMGNVEWDDGEVVKKCSNYLLEYQKYIDNVPAQIYNFVKKTQEMV